MEVRMKKALYEKRYKDEKDNGVWVKKEYYAHWTTIDTLVLFCQKIWFRVLYSIGIAFLFLSSSLTIAGVWHIWKELILK